MQKNLSRPFDGGKKPYKIVGGFRGEIYNVAQRWVGFTGEGDWPNSQGSPGPAPQDGC